MRRILAFASVALMLSAQANAADLYQPEPVAPVAVEQPVMAAANGWYLRGDASYDFTNMKGAHYFAGSNKSVIPFDKHDVNNTGNVGVGIGYQVNDYFRVDKTFDYMFGASFRGSTSTNGGSGSGACFRKCVSTDKSTFSAYSLMANAYVDIYKWGIFTPYAGFGLGGTRVSWDNLKNVACAADGSGCDGETIHKGKDSWRFTYALMAGTTIDINCQFKGDVGYRYRHVSGGNMFGYKANGGPGSDKGFDIHEVRTGLRYQFGDSCQEAYLPPVDLPTQPEPVFK